MYSLGGIAIVAVAVLFLIEMAKLLLINGADINKKAKDGKSALALSMGKNNTEMTAL